MFRKNLFKKFGFQGLIAAASLVAPMRAFGESAPDLPDSGIEDPGDLIDLVCDLAGWMFTFIVVFAIVAILVAAFRYLTANGDAEAVEGANKALIFAAVAVAIGVVARAVPLVVQGFLDTSGGGSGC